MEQKKYNILSIIGFILALLPYVVILSALFYQNKTEPTLIDKVLLFLLKSSLFTSLISIILSIISLLQITKTNEKGKNLSIWSIVLSSLVLIIWILITFVFPDGFYSRPEIPNQTPK